MGKRGFWIIIGILVVAGAILFTLSIEKVTVLAPPSALMEQGWHADFSAPLKQEVLGTKDLYVTNERGKRILADFVVGTDRQSLVVNGLAPGTYALHLKKNALAGKSFKWLPVSKVNFAIHKTIESVASEKKLKAYFERAQEIQKSTRFNSSEVETSSMEDKAVENSSESTDYSTTNNQVEGVDEADSVKTDGNFIYSVMGNQNIVITDIKDPRKIKKASVIEMEEEFYPSQLFLHGDTLAVIGEKYNPDESDSSSDTEKISMMPMNQMTTVRLYNIVNRESPELIREIGTEGYLNGARKTGGMLYLVTNVHPNYWMIGGEEEGVLRPYTYDSKLGKDSELIDYADISILPGAMEPSYSVITAMDLSVQKDNKVVTKGYLGGSEQLYMSGENIYLTATLYQGDTTSWQQGKTNTELFKFALNGIDVTFQNSAEVKGNILNQFSMDEYEGNFRVVTTEGNMWDDKNPSENHLFIMNRELKPIGSVEGLAKGERIYSARFMGDKAYMVTFRETDPLFVIDVANPAAPKVLGELKIPGFSNYLHPLDGNHLIGFGYDTIAKQNKEGGEPIIERQGMKVSLFDVSDFANPKEKDMEIIGGKGTYSSIEYDHKALFTHKKRNLYGFPIMIYNESGKSEAVDFNSSGALIYEITPTKGIVLKGDLLENKFGAEQYEEWEKEIKRMLFSDNILYTIAMKEIKSYSLETYAKIGEITID